MKLTSLQLKHFRNIAELTLCPGDHINIIYGDNAQGKTNLIEAIWLFTGNQSFRGSKVSELIAFEQPGAEARIVFEDVEREQTAVLKIGAKREILLNQVPLKKKGDLAGHFYCVIFSPDDLDFVKGSPRIRRKFLDEAIAQITPQYLDYLDQYEKTLEQRNALLKDLYKQPYLRDTLDIWDLQLAKLGTILSIYRRDYVEKLSVLASSIYSGLSSGKEDFSVRYQSSAFELAPERYEDAAITTYFEALQQGLSQDMRQGFTGTGIHRDDVEVCIGGLYAKTYGSQGQQRSAILTLKLAEANLLQKVTGELPIILLDDVMSELDAKRQDYILNHVRDGQVFITCCDSINTMRLNNGRVFHIEEGTLADVTESKQER